MNDQMIFSSSVVDLAEEQDYLSLRNRVCFFNDKNLNNVQIDYDDSTLEKCQTLVNMPVVAFYRKVNGKDDLGGHEVKVVDGKVKFGTATIGTVTSVEIVEEDVETVTGEVKTLPVLYADERIWTRNENATKAIRRLYSDGRLFSSWEIKTSEYTFKDSIKHLVDYSFLSNCLLGTKSYPAYGTGGAVVTDVSEASDQYEYLAAESLLSEALILDIESGSASDNQGGKEEDNIMEAENKILEGEEQDVSISEEGAQENEQPTSEVEQPEVSEEAQENQEGEPEVSENQEAEESEANDTTNDNSAMKTDLDIYRMLEAAVAKETESEEYWYSVSMIFPEDHILLCRSWKMPTLNYVKFAYSIDGDNVTLSDREAVELVISPLQINSEIEKRNNAIAEANNRIAVLEAENAELVKAKEELDKIKSEQAEAEKAEAIAKLKDYVTRSGCFSEEEIQSEEVQNAINSLNETWLKAQIADRYIASINSKNVATAENASGNDSNVSFCLAESGKEDAVTSEDVMREFFKS